MLGPGVIVAINRVVRKSTKNDRLMRDRYTRFSSLSRPDLRVLSTCRTTSLLSPPPATTSILVCEERDPCACPSSSLKVQQRALLRSLSAADPSPTGHSQSLWKFACVADARQNVGNVVIRSCCCSPPNRSHPCAGRRRDPRQPKRRWSHCPTRPRSKAGARLAFASKLRRPNGRWLRPS